VSKLLTGVFSVLLFCALKASNVSAQNIFSDLTQDPLLHQALSLTEEAQKLLEPQAQCPPLENENILVHTASDEHESRFKRESMPLVRQLIAYWKNYGFQPPKKLYIYVHPGDSITNLDETERRIYGPHFRRDYLQAIELAKAPQTHASRVSILDEVGIKYPLIYFSTGELKRNPLLPESEWQKLLSETLEELKAKTFINWTNINSANADARIGMVYLASRSLDKRLGVARTVRPSYLDADLVLHEVSHTLFFEKLHQLATRLKTDESRVRSRSFRQRIDTLSEGFADVLEMHFQSDPCHVELIDVHEKPDCNRRGDQGEIKRTPGNASAHSEAQSFRRFFWDLTQEIGKDPTAKVLAQATTQALEDSLTKSDPLPEADILAMEHACKLLSNQAKTCAKLDQYLGRTP
jgi:hypothetical protein